MATSERKRKILTLEERMEVLIERDKGKSERKLAKMFGCGKTQISKTIKNRETLLKEWRESKPSGMKRKRKEKFRGINDALLEWCESARAENIPLSGTSIKKKGLQIAEELNIKDFTASNGWLEKFCHRNGINFREIFPAASTRVEPENHWDNHYDIPEISECSQESKHMLMSLEETLQEVNRLIESSAAVQDEKISCLFEELKRCLEIKVSEQKSQS